MTVSGITLPFTRRRPSDSLSEPTRSAARVQWDGYPMYIPDPVERIEDWQERMIHTYSNGDGTWRCAGCGRIVMAGNLRQAGASPFGVPVCESCQRSDRIEVEEYQ